MFRALEGQEGRLFGPAERFHLKPLCHRQRRCLSVTLWPGADGVLDRGKNPKNTATANEASSKCIAPFSTQSTFGQKQRLMWQFWFFLTGLWPGHLKLGR